MIRECDRGRGAFAPAPLARCCSWHYSFLVVHPGEPLILEEHRGCLMIRKHLTFWSIAFLALSYAFSPGGSNLFLRTWKDTYKGTRKVNEGTSTKSWNLHVPSIDIPHVIFLYSPSPILHTLQTEVLWQLCAKQFYGCHFSTAFAHFVALCHMFCNSFNISNFPILLYMLCDLWSVTFDITITKKITAPWTLRWWLIFFNNNIF